MLSFDMYRRPILLLLPDGHGMYRTLLGSLLSLLTLAVVITYGVYKTSDLIEKKDYKV